VADEIQRWFENGALDGINLAFRVRDELENFIDTVVPILQERGLYRREYESDTLRGNLGLPFPVNRYTQKREAAGAADDSGAPASDFVNA
jgi:hypothetical protein